MTVELRRVATLTALCCVFLAALGGGATYALYTDRIDVDVSISVADDVGSGPPGQQSAASVHSTSNEVGSPDDMAVSTASETSNTTTSNETADASGNDSLVGDTDSEQPASMLQRPSSDSP